MLILAAGGLAGWGGFKLYYRNETITASSRAVIVLFVGLGAGFAYMFWLLTQVVKTESYPIMAGVMLLGLLGATYSFKNSIILGWLPRLLMKMTNRNKSVIN